MSLRIRLSLIISLLFVCSMLLGVSFLVLSARHMEISIARSQAERPVASLYLQPPRPETPEHWEVKPLKRWVRLHASTLGQKTNPDFEFRYVDLGSVQTGRLVKKLERIRFEAAPSRARRVLRQGGTIISTVRTYLKAIWYVGEDADDLIASTGFAVLTPGKSVEPEYLGYVIQSSAFVTRVAANSIGIAYPAIAKTMLGRFPVALPPTVGEQRAIIAHIKTENAQLATRSGGCGGRRSSGCARR